MGPDELELDGDESLLPNDDRSPAVIRTLLVHTIVEAATFECSIVGLSLEIVHALGLSMGHVSGWTN